jgi:hypothetical protein
MGKVTSLLRAVVQLPATFPSQAFPSAGYSAVTSLPCLDDCSLELDPSLLTKAVCLDLSWDIAWSRAPRLGVVLRDGQETVPVPESLSSPQQAHRANSYSLTPSPKMQKYWEPTCTDFLERLCFKQFNFGQPRSTATCLCICSGGAAEESGKARTKSAKDLMNGTN